MQRTIAPQRMEVWSADLPMKMGSSVQGGIRPVVIISNDVCNEVSSVITVAPLTSRMKKLNLPTHAVIDTPDGGQSVILAEQIMTIDKSCLNNRLGKIKAHDMKKIETAILAQLGMKGEQE